MTIKPIDQVFRQSLTVEDQSILDALMEKAKSKSVFSQQLALDASRLLTTSAARLDRIKNRGFFRRCYSAFTGQNQKIINENNADLISIQRLAWNYLQELQEQNLLQAQSIATIRNNLSQVGEILYETRDFLEQAIDKIINIEGRVTLVEWALNIKANKRRFREYPKAILILYLIYDFIKSNRGINFHRNDINHIIVLLEEMNISCDEELRFIDFIVGLINDIAIVGVESYQELIDLSHENIQFSNQFINEEISSRFFNSLYLIANDYRKINRFTSDEVLCDSNEKFERIVSKFFDEEFDFLNSHFTLREVIEEIVGSSVLAINIYKEKNSLEKEIEFVEEKTRFQTQDDEVKNLEFIDEGEIEVTEYNDSFDDLIEKLNSLHLAGLKFASQNLEITMKVKEYSVYFDDSDFGFDTGFFSKIGSAISGTVVARGRASCTSELNDYKKTIEEFISDNRQYLSEVNRIIRQYDLEGIEFKNNLDSSDIDLDTSTSNDDWSNQFFYISDQIEEALDSFLQACDLAVQQLELFRNHEYDKSIFQVREEAKKERVEQEKQERENKKVVILEDGKKLSINWEKLDNLPCYSEDIRFIEVIDHKWLLTDKMDNLFVSHDGREWKSIEITCLGKDFSIKEIKIEDNVCIIFPDSYEEEGFIYSFDGIDWERGSIPGGVDYHNGLIATDNIVRFKDIWLWRFTKRAEYSYTEKGIIFDSVETSDYKKSVIVASSSLNGEWKNWGNSLSLDEGLEIKKIAILPNSQTPIVWANYDYYYVSRKKKVDAQPVVYYLSGSQRWRRCTWELDKLQDEIIVDKINDLFYCQPNYYELFKSKNGFEWEKMDIDLSIEKILKLPDFNIYVSSSRLYISIDMNDFHEIMLDEGRWDKFSLKGESVLALYSPSKHEDYLMLGTLEVEMTADTAGNQAV